MIRIDYLLFGYKIFTVKKEEVVRCAELFLKNNLSVSFHKNSFYAGVKKSKSIENLLNGKIEYTKSELYGLGGFIYRNRKRYGVFAAIIICAVILLLSSDRVWDIRVECEDEILASEIENELSICGFRVGSSWSRSDFSHIENEMLLKSENVSWMNINRRGTVAYVSVIKKELHDEPQKKEGYSNIVATCDAVIEDITVLRGVAAVKVGDVVKKGDLLISGVISSELGGGFCYAEGIVTGRVSGSVEVTVSNFREVKEPKKARLSEYKIRILNFYINIFKTGRKTREECDIIEKEDGISILEKKLPIAVYRKYDLPYQKASVYLSKDEMVLEASEKMADELNKRLS